MTFPSPSNWRTTIEQCQQAFHHARDEAQFRENFCQALLAAETYAAAWIALGNYGQNDVHVVARAGLEAEDCAALPCLEIELDGLVCGHLGLCAVDDSAFGDDARAWLALVAQTLSLGIAECRRRAEQMQEMEFFSTTVDRLMQQVFAVDQHAIISMTDEHGVITYVNDKFCEISQYSNEEMLGNKHNILNSGVHPSAFFADMWNTISSGNIWNGEVCNRRKDGKHYWVESTIVPFPAPSGSGYHYVSVRTEITSLKRLEENLRWANEELEQRVALRTEELELANKALEVDIQARMEAEGKLQQKQEEHLKLIGELKSAQNQLLQSEKMASIGQLAAGVAHEINNPIGYVHSNLGTLEKYIHDLFSVLDLFETAEGELSPSSATLARIRAYKDKLDLSFLKEDIPSLMNESKEGITRVKKIVQDLKDFSHVDEAEWQWCDLHKGLDSTLNIVWNELKYKADVAKEYGTLPEVECIPSQLNQVFMNLLVNAGHAIENRGTITIRTGQENGQIWVEVQDTGKGIAPEHLGRIFDPFFTTKPVGKGTGLGLSLSYGIVQKHHGRIEVTSTPGVGTTFRVHLPVKQVEKAS